MTLARVLLSLLKFCYFLLFAAATLIVVLYLVFRIVVRAPQVEEEVTVTLPAAAEQLKDEIPEISSVPADPDPDVTAEPEPTPEVITLTRREGVYTFLLMGCDDGNGNADTIMVGSFDTANGKISVLSVPRDTLVDVSRTVKKINAAYGIGGVEQLLDELEGILGFRPDHYIKVDLNAFVAVVDHLGGVSFYVPEEMHHNDGAGFIIDLQQGTQWLSGEQAMQLVRYRGYANADLGRIQTQQKFLKELAKQLISRSTLSDVDDYAAMLNKYLDTDLSVTELAWFGTKAFSLDFTADISFATLPGDGSASYKGINWYYELDAGAARELINSTVNPYTTDIPAALQRIFQVP